MKKKEDHLMISIALSLLGLILFLADYISNETFQGIELLFFGLLIMGWYGITRYIYDK